MAKQIGGFIKLQIKGGAASPNPPIGPCFRVKRVKFDGVL